MIATLFFLFASLIIISLFSFKINFIKRILFVLLGVIFILIAGFRGDNVANDYGVYMDYWGYRTITDAVEVSFIWIKSFLKNYLEVSHLYLFLTYAFFGVTAKFYAIDKLSKHVFLALLVYLSHFYILHELTQIRIGAASGFFLIAVYYRLQKQYKACLLFLLIAIFFHYSSFVGIIILVLNDKKIKYFYFLVPLGYVLYYFNNQFNISIPIPYFQSKLEAYKEMKKYGLNDSDQINVFNFVFLVRILILYLFFLRAKAISEYYPHVYTFIKIYSISLFSFLFLADIPAFSFRIQEFFGVIEIILLPCLVYAFPKKTYGKIIVVFIALGFLLIDLYYNKYVFN